MTSTLKYNISDQAYVKCVLHAAKYPTAVCGLFLGSTQDGVVQLTDCLPVAHSPTTVFTTATTEIALLLSAKVAESRDEHVVGVYFGNEVADDRSIGTVPTRLACHVRDSFSDAVLLMIEAPKLSPSRRLTEHAFRVCHAVAGDTWGRGELPEDALSVGTQLLKACDALLTDSDAAYTVADFEDHCNDVEEDWLNLHVKNVQRAAVAAS